MMEAASTSETSVKFYQTTRHNNPEDSHLPFVVYICPAAAFMKPEVSLPFFITFCAVL
jgi:hypothetical protein